MPELDTIRGLAILGVLLYHSLYWQVDVDAFSPPIRLFLKSMWVGRMGVNLFFVLSGFLITGILMDSRWRPDYYKRFYIRRALRILPAYFALILVLAAARLAPPSFLLLSVVYLSNLTPLWGIPIAYPVLWSLAVEEHFYFLWPAIVKKLSNKALLICGLTVVFLTPFSRLFSFFLDSHKASAWFVCNEYTWNSLDGLACGALASILLRQFDPSRRQVVRIAMGLVALALAIWVVGLPFGILSRRDAVGAALQPVPWQFLFTGLLFGSLVLGTGVAKKLVQVGWLQFLGKISYGLYLVHLLVFEGVRKLAETVYPPSAQADFLGWLLFRCVVGSFVAILIAYLSRKYFEDPFLRMKNRLS